MCSFDEHSPGVEGEEGTSASTIYLGAQSVGGETKNPGDQPIACSPDREYNSLHDRTLPQASHSLRATPFSPSYL
jgi:hypothetical protein